MDVRELIRFALPASTRRSSAEVLAVTVSRYLKKQSRYFASDKILIRFFGNLYKSIDPKPQKGHYETMVEKLEAIKNDEKEAEVFEYFDLLAWAKEKLSNQKG